MNQQDTEKLLQALMRSRDDFTRRNQRQQDGRRTDRDRDVMAAMRNRP